VLLVLHQSKVLSHQISIPISGLRDFQAGIVRRPSLLRGSLSVSASGYNRPLRAHLLPAACLKLSIEFPWTSIRFNNGAFPSRSRTCQAARAWRSWTTWVKNPGICSVPTFGITAHSSVNLRQTFPLCHPNGSP
jgi:hypothetical protein